MATEIVYAVWPAPVWPLIATAMLATDRGDGVGEFASHDFGRHGHGQSSPSGPRPQQSSNCRLRCSGRCDFARKGLRSWLASSCSLLGVTQAPVAHLGPFSGVRERGSSCSIAVGVPVVPVFLRDEARSWHWPISAISDVTDITVLHHALLLIVFRCTDRVGSVVPEVSAPPDCLQLLSAT